MCKQTRRLSELTSSEWECRARVIFCVSAGLISCYSKMYTGVNENGILIALQRSSSKHLPRMSHARSLELSYFVHAAARLRPKMLLRVAASCSSLTACVLLSTLLLTLQMFPNACTFSINAKNSYYETICNLPSSRPSPHMSDDA